MGKRNKKLDRALESCDAIEEIAGSKKAPATAVLAARLMAGSEAEFKTLASASAETVPWSEVASVHAEHEDQDDDEDDDADEDRPRRAGGGRR